MENSYISVERLMDLFNTHPEVSIFLITSDGQAFFDLQTAGSHAQRLIRDRNVIEVSREDLVANAVSFIDGISQPPIGVSEELRAKYEEFLKQENSENNPSVIDVPALNILGDQTAGDQNELSVSSTGSKLIDALVGAVRAARMEKDSADLSKVAALTDVNPVIAPGVEGAAVKEPTGDLNLLLPEDPALKIAPVQNPVVPAAPVVEPVKAPEKKVAAPAKKVAAPVKKAAVKGVKRTPVVAPVVQSPATAESTSNVTAPVVPAEAPVKQILNPNL
jgi:hypothetical protein